MDFFDRTVEEFIRNASEKLVMKKGKVNEDMKEDHIRWKVSYFVRLPCRTRCS